MKRFKFFWTLVAIAFAGAVAFVSCEKESEKDYRDKWVGEYSCKKEMQTWRYCLIYHGDTLVDMPQQFISWTADGTMTVERYGSNKLRFISDMISNNDYDTTGYNPNNKSNGWGWNIQHFRDTITLEVDDSGNLIALEHRSYNPSNIGHCNSNNIEFGMYSGGHGGGGGYKYKCTR